jgi:GNAT superfamily N-acetyltransferase
VIDGEYSISEQIPFVEEYLALRSAVRWGSPTPKTAESGLRDSLLCVCVRCQGALVGFGRVVGDGHFVFYVQDMIVHPDHQGKGLGRAVMDRILAYVEDAGGEDAYIGLMAARGAVAFYEHFGFSERPAGSPGMQKLPGFRCR